MINRELYTIGYGNRTTLEVFALLRKQGIEELIDVRSVPHSRYRPMFNRNNLAIQAKSERVEYTFKGNELGAKFNGGYPSYDILRQRPEYMEGLQYLISRIEEGYNIAIMCCELEHLKCHRYSLIGEDIFQLGYNVVHIGKQGELIKHTKRLI